MAEAIITTSINNATDSQSNTLAVSIDGVPNTVSTIITNRIFTPKTNYKFTKPPHISFTKTSNPNRYSYSSVNYNDGSYGFTVKYHHALKQPTTDIIEFFSETKASAVSTSKKIFGWNIKTTDVNPSGESRTLNVTGDAYARVKISVTQNPKIGPTANETILVKGFNYR